MTEEQKATRAKLLDELESLGQQLATAVKSLWDSEDSRKLRQEIGDGFVELGQQLDYGGQDGSGKRGGQGVREQVKETMDKARESDVAGKVEEGLLTGLRELNQELSKLVGSPEASRGRRGSRARSPRKKREA